MTNKQKKLYIKIPTKIVRNEDNIFLSNDNFILYARLSFLYFRNYGDKIIELDHRKLMRFCKMNDARTFRKRLANLYAAGLIENEISKLPTKGVLQIIFNETMYNEAESFTLISAELFNYYELDKIDQYAFRQIMYYKSHINMKDKGRDRAFCFVGYDTLAKRLKITKRKVQDANEQLQENKLIRIKKSKLETDYAYNEDDELIFERFNNHYYVAQILH